MLFFATFPTIFGGGEHAFYIVFTSRNTFLTFWGKSCFFVVFDLDLAQWFAQFSPKMQPQAFKRTPLKKPRKKTEKNTSK